MACSVAGRAALITTANCSATFGNSSSSTSSPSACSATANVGGIPGVFSSASISGTQTIPPLGSPGSPASISFSVSTGTSAAVFSGYSDDANVSGSDNLTLYTAGPVRAGEAVITESVTLTGVLSNLTGNMTLGPLSASCTESASAEATCTGAGPTNGNGTFTVPFTLGQPFTFSLGVFNDSAGGSSAPHFGTGEVSLSFTLLEANGTTPVQVFTPEPSTYGLLGCGLLALIAISLKRLRIAR